jgi:ABC-2 type transport system permease protein
MASPIIMRELRVEARDPSQFAIRVLSALAVAGIFVFLLKDDPDASASLGVRLFASIHTLALLGICLIGPILTADSLSREKREGTLCLLFPTMLTAQQVVLGKGFVHIVRALALWFAALPFLAIPFLLGGVSWIDVLSAFTLQACAMLLALSSGLVASSLTKRPVAALLLAEGICWPVVAFFRSVFIQICVLRLGPVLPARAFGAVPNSVSGTSTGFDTGWMNEGGWSEAFRSASAPVLQIWGSILAGMLFLALLVFALFLAVASWRTARTWRETPPTAGQARRRQTWLEPRFWLDRFRQRRALTLDRNPLSWLHQYSASMRTSKLAWCCLILLADSLIMLSRNPWMWFNGPQVWLSILLCLHMVFVAGTGFRRELESGVLELLLITPMPVNEIVLMQLGGFWQKFWLPVFALVTGWQLMVFLDLATPSGFDVPSFVILNFLTLPIIGLAASLRFLHPATICLIGGLLALGLPLFVPELANGFLERVTSLEWPWFFSYFPAPAQNSEPALKLVRLVQVLAALASWFLLDRMLAKRTFSILRSAP